MNHPTDHAKRSIAWPLAIVMTLLISLGLISRAGSFVADAQGFHPPIEM